MERKTLFHSVSTFLLNVFPTPTPLHQTSPQTTAWNLKGRSVQTLLLIYQSQLIAQEKHDAVGKFRAPKIKAFYVLSLIYPGICSNGAVSMNYSKPFLLSGSIYSTSVWCEGCECKSTACSISPSLYCLDRLYVWPIRVF